jgi:hypothetical protein
MRLKNEPRNQTTINRTNLAGNACFTQGSGGFA